VQRVAGFGDSDQFEISEYFRGEQTRGTFTLTITAKAGANIHSATVSITVK